MTQNNDTSINELFGEIFASRGLNDAKLSYLTNIPERFIIAIRNGETSKLPAEPYVRGYLKKIAQILKIDESEFIEIYKKTSHKSKRNHKLPENRFKLIGLDKKWVLGISSIVLIALFLIFRIDSIIGIPELNVSMPEESYSSSLIISGDIESRDSLTINGEVVYTDEEGNFTYNTVLSAGINTFEFRVSRFLGKEVKIIKQIYYQPINNQNG